MREPDAYFVQLATNGAFVPASATGARVRYENGRLTIASVTAIARVAVRWNSGVPFTSLVFGDEWERTYGDTVWEGIRPHRALPWYWLAASDGGVTGAGVKTGPGAWCSWTVDVDGITLWADVRSGTEPLELGDRELLIAELVSLESSEVPYRALEELVAALAPTPIATGPIVGSNNWYYAYGQGFDADAVVSDARMIVRLADGHSIAPFGVIDAGWGVGDGSCEGGPWDRGKDSFANMTGVAERIAAEGARPGLWYRPLLSREKSSVSHPVFRDGGYPIDPTLPGVLESIGDDIRRFRSWGYELIKHDFSTFDITGSFAPQMGPNMGAGLFTFADRSRSTAEIITDVYRAIAAAAEDAVVIGCNTVGHLAAGLVAVQRIGDDTSGKHWERTRRMGINTLAARLPQHGRFFVADADCVPATPATPWALNRQFLDLIARSGTALFISADPRSLTPEVEADIARALAVALDGGAADGIEPLDFVGNATPRTWRGGDATVEYDWSGPIGALPFDYL